MWYIVDSFSNCLWSLFLTSIPIYLLTMGLADYFFWGYADWDNISGFVLRNVLSAKNYRTPHCTQAYQIILIGTWIWCMHLLVLSYASNLTAMLTKPKLQNPIKTFEELMSQDEISWVIEKGGLPEHYMSTSAPGSLMKRLFERATIIPRDWAQPCYTSETKQKGEYGSFCQRGNIMTLIAEDFSKTGKCNYYRIEDRFLTSGSAMAFQVLEHSFSSWRFHRPSCVVISERKSLPGRFQPFDGAGVPDGLFMGREGGEIYSKWHQMLHVV